MSDADEDSQLPTGDSSFRRTRRENAEAFRAAARFIREGAGADASVASHEVRQRAEQEEVIRWIQEGHGRLLPDEDLAEWLTLSDKTSEHKVLTHLSPKRVLKVTWPGFYGQIPVYEDGKLLRVNACPSDYLERQALQIEVFAGDLTLEGVNISDKPSMVINEPAGQPSFVVSQEFVEAADVRDPNPSTQQIASFMAEHGFEAIPGSYFGWLRRKDGVAVVDAKCDNFILSPEGVVPIDLQMMRVPESAMPSTEGSSLILP
ncbi:MAG TPA: hypothetical protein VGO11_26155 [Chthoniobacteraceae bacterium]|nr:hypothetical protein [Chthoniobacteraceae bacterium]